MKTKPNKTKPVLDKLKEFLDYVWNGNSFGSYILFFLFAFIVIKFLVFPGLSLLLNNDYPIVAIVSGSMEHKIVNHKVCDKYIVDVKNTNLKFDEWWDFCADYYVENLNITKDEFMDFKYQNGLNIGDVMILYGKNPAKIKIGEVLVFIPQDRSFYEQKGPVIHRVVDKWQEDGKWYFKTKGDHNPISLDNFEVKIPQDDVIGVGTVRIPLIGYLKIMLNEIFISFVRIIR